MVANSGKAAFLPRHESRRNQNQRKESSVSLWFMMVLLLLVIGFVSYDYQRHDTELPYHGFIRSNDSRRSSSVTRTSEGEKDTTIGKEDRSRNLDLRFLWGGAGLAFDAKNNLIVPQMVPQKINTLDPETGDILDSFHDSVHFVNDVVVAPDGTIYWTVLLFGTVFKRTLEGTTEAMFPPFSYPSVDGIALSDNGDRLFFSQCRNVGSNYIYQTDLKTGATMRIGESAFFCRASSLAYRKDALYATNFISGEMFKVDIRDPENPIETEITTLLQSPSKIAFDSKGDMYASDFISGGIYKIELPDRKLGVDSNAELIATAPGGLEGLAFDKRDRLYVTSFFHGSIYEMIRGKENSEIDFRVVRSWRQHWKR